MNFTVENNILKGADRPIDTNQKLGQVIYDALNESPDHVSQIAAETGEKTTFAEMKDRSVRCALWMKKFGISAHDIVIAVTHNHLDSYIPMFATFFVDAIFSAWNPNITLYTARRFMTKFRPKLIFTCEEAADVLREAAMLENLNVEFAVFGKHSDVQSLNDILDSQTPEEVNEFKVVNEKNPQDVAVIILSSGSTGFQKGVMMTNISLIRPPTQRKDFVSKVVMWYSVFDWLSGISCTIDMVTQKNTRIIPGDSDPQSFFEIVEKYKVNEAVVLPLFVSYLAKYELTRDYDLRSFECFILGGHKYTKKILEDLKCKVPTAAICQAYGSTECGIITFSFPTTKHIDSTGFVLSNRQVKFVDLLTNETLGPNKNGELCVKSPNMMIGYYEDPEATCRTFDEEGWYRTGDIGYYNEDGEVFIVDRIKEIVKYRSYQISPTEIEEVLLSHPQVQEAAVVAIPHELDGYWPAAFVVKTPGSTVSADELIELMSVLEDYKQLRGGIHFLDQLPRTGSGKIAKNELKQFVESLIKQ